MSEIEETIDHVEETVEPQAPEPVEPTLDEMKERLRAAGEWPETKTPDFYPQQPQYQQPQPEVIEGTNLVKPNDYDSWGLDRQMAYISQQTAMGFTQATTAATRNYRAIESEGKDWYKSELQEVLDGVDPMWLSQPLSKQMSEQIHQMAMGKAVASGKSPVVSKPVPNASPVSTGGAPQTAPSGEVDLLLAGIADAGYDLVAKSPKIRELLSK